MAEIVVFTVAANVALAPIYIIGAILYTVHHHRRGQPQ